MKLVLDGTNILLGQTTNHTRLPAQKVHNSKSDCWIKLEFLQEFPKDIFPSVNNISLLDAATSRSAKPPTRLEYRVKRSITLD
jgi:hypothetical protein